MIGFFPIPYPDELLYSVCARYGERAGYSNKKEAIKSLFGSRSFSAIVDFPNRLEHFLEQLPFSNFTTDDLINRNTLFTLYEPFLAADRAAAVRGEMKSAAQNNIRARLAINVNQVNAAKYLRFCPLCIADDRHEYGQAYWHRAHQLDGILVCVRHNCFLQDGTVGLNRESASGFHVAEDSLNVLPVKKLDSRDPDHKLFFSLAESAVWLLNQTDLFLEEGRVRNRFFNLLLKKGYAYYNGRVRNGDLFDAFSNRISETALERLGCTLWSPNKSWLTKLLEESRNDVFHHPLRYLLLMNFLEITAEEFFTRFTEYKPFNDGPYPCFNKGSDHYKKLYIGKCEIFDNHVRKERRKPVAVFKCECGFKYRRVGPDTCEKDSYEYSSVIEYGPVWEKKLKALWDDTKVSLTGIATVLGVSTLLVVRHAIRLNLRMNEEGARTVSGYDRHRNPNKTFSEILNENRDRWLRIVAANAALSRQELMDISGNLYLWLQRNDSLWFGQHLPPTTGKPRTGDILDWVLIDDDLSAEVKKVCREISFSTDPLIRVSITEIIRRAGNRNWLEKRHLKLPKTAAVIDLYIESPEAYMLRKIPVLRKEFLDRGVPVSKTEFVTKGDLRNFTARNSKLIQDAIAAAIEKINIAAARSEYRNQRKARV